MTEDRVFNNASWHGPTGQEIGGGDIALGHPERVASNLEKGEMLAIIPSYRAKRTRSHEDNPGQDFISENFGMLIVPRCIYIPGEDGSYATLAQRGLSRNYTEYPTISPESALGLMQTIAKLNEEPGEA
jgi:hypothetical protein